MINENKMWYKTIPEILNWLESKSEMNWLFLDTETTGLLGPKKEQVTQVSGIVVQYNYSANTFNELDTYDQKIKLNTDIKSRIQILEPTYVDVLFAPEASILNVTVFALLA